MSSIFRIFDTEEFDRLIRSDPGDLQKIYPCLDKKG